MFRGWGDELQQRIRKEEGKGDKRNGREISAVIRRVIEEFGKDATKKDFLSNMSG